MKKGRKVTPLKEEQMKKKNTSREEVNSKNLTNRKAKIIKNSVLITSIFIICLSITYAFLSQTLFGEKRQVITAGNLSLELLEDENNLAITNALPMYDEVGMIQDPFTFRLVNKTNIATNYILKLEEIQVEGGLAKSDVKYGFTKDGDIKIDLVSNIVDNVIDEGTIKGNQTIEYSLRLWVRDDITDITTIQNKSIRFKLNMKANQKTSEEENRSGLLNELAFDEENLGDDCSIYERTISSGTTYYLRGQCANNYVSYSGKLWRVVSKENEKVSLITEDAMGEIAYKDTNVPNQSDYENSIIDQWLTQEFFPTLHNPEKYIDTNNELYYGYWYNNSTLYKTLIRPVTLFRSGTYLSYTKLNGSSYLVNDTKWMTMEVRVDAVKNTFDIVVIDQKGCVNCTQSSSSSQDIRPVIHMLPEVNVISGMGTKEKPYRLEGEEQVSTSVKTLLNTRYSGEYINFNDELYRIVGVENNLTKIVSVNEKSGIVFNDYYNSLPQLTKNMIEPNTKWYNSSTYNTHYKGYICKTINANISTKDCEKLSPTTATISSLRQGELFGKYRDRYNNRPAMYLKADVIISADNKGNGSYEKPYQITRNDFSIGNGELYTNNRTVALNFSGSSSLNVCISNTEDCTNYEPFSPTKNWTLTEGDGEKSVYVYYKNATGEITDTFIRSITLDQTPPADNNIQISSEDSIFRNLTLSSTGADYMCISNTSSNANDCTNWIDYATTYNWSLSLGNGEKTVYAHFKDKAGNATSVNVTTTCTDCNSALEDFSSNLINDNFSNIKSESYPWVVRNNRFESNNKGKKTSSSISTITFTIPKNGKLSFDYGVSSEARYDKLTITLTPEGGTTKKLVTEISGVSSGKVTDEPLTAGTTYTLTLTYSKDSSGDKNDDIGYIDNLYIILD